MLEVLFPGLATCRFEETSPSDENYNCIAWAAGDKENWWWPVRHEKPNYWPKAVPTEETVDAFIQAFATMQYMTCDNGDYQSGFEKVALYADANGKPTHMAKQLPDGTWSSKIGELPDIKHDKLEGLEGTDYGNVVRFLRRPVSPRDLD